MLSSPADEWRGRLGDMSALASQQESAVPRYFFNFHDGYDFIDSIGSEHPDISSVRAEAVETIGERLRGTLLNNKDVSAWLMNVRNEAGFTVLILSLAATVQVVLPKTLTG